MSGALHAPVAASTALDGVHALVTGGGSGIGLAIAHRLASMGAQLTLVGRDLERLVRAVGELTGAGRHVAKACDVGDAHAVSGLFRMLTDEARVPQLLVNNAGTAASARLSETSQALWDETLRTNLTGVFNCTRAALEPMVAMPFARIVSVASTAGLTGYRDVAAYCAAKHGVVGLTRAVALEVARTGVTVNAVCPGYTDTAIATGAIANIARATGKSEADARAALLQRNPQRRLVAPEEVAAAVAWLCLPESQSINGQAIALAGGEVMTG
jgi:NAD(P)-dependent dehydrogenase (short-subunit alcohol dehydrogenase family)